MKTTLTALMLFAVLTLNIYAQYAPHTVLEGHTGSVNSVAFSPDGKTIASGSRDKNIGLWEVDTGKQIRTVEVEIIDRSDTFHHTLEGHTSRVNSVAFSPDGKTIASGSNDETIRLWNATTSEHIRTLRGHTDSVSSVVFSPDGQTLASGSLHNNTRLWNVATGEHIRTLRGLASSVVFSPDGQTLVSVRNNNIHLWNAITGEHIRTLTVDRVLVATFSPDGRYLAGVSPSDDKIYVWHAHSGKHYRTLTVYNDVYSIAFSPDGQTLASGGKRFWSRNGIIQLWHVPTGTELHTFVSEKSIVYSIAFSPDGQTLASGNTDNNIRLWNASTGVYLHTFIGHTGDVTSVAFSPDGQTLASGGADNSVRLWPLDLPRYLRAIPMDGVTSVAFSPDGQTLASGSLDNNTRLWNANTGELTHTLIGHTYDVISVVFSPDGQTLASGSESGEIRLWNAMTGEVLKTWHHSSGGILSDIAFSPNGQTLASAHRPYTPGGGIFNLGDGYTILWDVTTGESLKSFSFPGYKQFSPKIYTSVAFSPDGHILAGGGLNGDEPVIQFWDVTTGEPTGTLTGHTATVNSIAFSPDGSMLASGSNKDSDGSISLWNTRTGKRMYTLERHTATVNSIAFSPDGSKLASGSSGRAIRLWKLSQISITPSEVESPAIGEQFSINVSIAGGGNIAGYQLTVGFDPTALRYVEAANGDYMSEGAFFVPPTVSGNEVTLGSTSLGGIRSGDGTLATLTFEVVDVKESNLILSNVILTDSDGELLFLLPTKDGRVVESAAIPSSTVVNITPSPVRSPTIGKQLTFNVDISGAENIADYHFTWEFDSTALKYISGSDVFDLVDGIDSGDGTLGTGTFKVLDVKPSTVGLSGYFIGSNGLRYIPTFENAEVVVPVSSAVVSVTPASVLSPAIGERITFNLDIAGGQNIANYHIVWSFDGSALQYTSDSVGDYLADGVGNGDGTLMSRTFKVIDIKSSTVSVSGHLVDADGLTYIPTFVSAKVAVAIIGDVNRDGVVNILDLVQVASSFAQPVPEEGNPADVNEDGVVNIVDLVIVAGELGSGAAAPSAWKLDTDSTLTREQVQKWLSEAQQLNLTDATSQRGILFLEQLLAALTPKKTALLPNYPNPFNPETWIPYQLSDDSPVSVSIYDTTGKLIRKLLIGFQSAGFYNSRECAAYWDGRNALGERVASGVYFYTLMAGEFTATHRMLILK